MWPRRTAAGFFVVCGSLALLLATVGLFGVTYFAVRQRTREFGVRIALGARSSDVVRQVLREGVCLAAPGAALGLVAAAIAGRLLARALLGVSAVDPISFTRRRPSSCWSRSSPARCRRCVPPRPTR